MHKQAFVEPKPGIKPSEAVKMKDISTDKLRTKDVKGTGGLETREGPKDSQAASSTGHATCKQLNKSEPSKKKAPGRIYMKFSICKNNHQFHAFVKLKTNMNSIIIF